VTLEPAAQLAFYTDGLVECRGADLDSRIATLMGLLEREADDINELCDGVLAQMVRADGGEDDIALLVVRLPATVADRSQAERMAVPRGIRSVRQARRFATALFARWRLKREVGDAARLVVNELVTNALLYGRSPVELVLRRTATMLYVEVFDASGHLPRRRLASTEDEGGRGLHLVAALSQRWGVRPAGDGKAVWAAISLTYRP
jgi:hypothetical protein